VASGLPQQCKLIAVFQFLLEVFESFKFPTVCNGTAERGVCECVLLYCDSTFSEMRLLFGVRTAQLPADVLMLFHHYIIAHVLLLWARSSGLLHYCARQPTAVQLPAIIAHIPSRGLTLPESCPSCKATFMHADSLRALICVGAQVHKVNISSTNLQNPIHGLSVNYSNLSTQGNSSFPTTCRKPAV
jgi:hypothetical protein